MSKKNIIWLASYPKSGNTWFRIFLTNLLYESDDPANINDLAETSISSSRKIFDEYTGLSSSDLTFEEIDTLRPYVYRIQSEESNELLFKKAHDKFYNVNKNQPLFPPEVSKGVIYFIRNPLDVLVSFAYHSAKPISRMLPSLNNSKYEFCGRDNKLQNQLRQILGSWSGHVCSWINQDLIPIHIMRYEDMINDTFNTFKHAVQFIGLKKTDKQIKTALAKSSFSVLSKQEKKDGFREKMIRTKFFFRKGQIGDWKNHLSEREVEKIVLNNKEIMLKFKYLDSNYKPIF